MIDRRRSARPKTDISGQAGMPRAARELMRFCGSLPDRMQGYVFDRFLRVSTREPVLTPASVFVAAGENCPYSGAQWIPVRRALKDLAPGPNDVFVDLGSGKGKVVLIAGRLPYQQAIGVEIDNDLSSCAALNIRQARSRLRAQHIESVNASVLDWAVPDDVSVLFMFNPFIGQTFRSALGRVFESYDRKPRELHIIYSYPWEHDWLLSTGRVSVENVHPGCWPARPRWWQRGDVIVCYHVGTHGGGASHARRFRSRRRMRALAYWSKPNGHRFAMSAPGQETLYSPAG
jgi:Histone methylation protein DOT1